MKGYRILLIIGIGLLCLNYVAKAENPVTWNFDLETYGSRDTWYSSPSLIDPGHLGYEYQWEITGTDVRVMGNWYSGQSGYNGAGTTGTLPISGLMVYHIDEPEVEADIFVSVDSSGYGEIYIDNINFGKANGYDVTGMKCNGHVTIAPEPATLIFMTIAAVFGRLKSKRS